MESVGHSSLHPHCYPQVVFATLNLSILYQTLYERTVRFYEKPDAELTRRAINNFDRIRALSNVSVDERICYFIKSTNLHNPQLYIIHNYFLDERDPPWINNKIKKLINEKNSAYKSYCHFQRDVFLFKKFKVPIKYVN